MKLELNQVMSIGSLNFIEDLEKQMPRVAQGTLTALITSAITKAYDIGHKAGYKECELDNGLESEDDDPDPEDEEEDEESDDDL